MLNHVVSLGKFVIISLIGLFLDTGIFAVLYYWLGWIIVPNIISSAFGIVCTYVLSAHYLWKDKHTYLQKLLFVLYYVAMILSVSYIIKGIALTFNYDPVFVKVIVICIIFIVNYMIVNKILSFKLDKM